MAIHSSILAWRILWTEEPSRLQSMGSHRVKHKWATSLSTFPPSVDRRTILRDCHIMYPCKDNVTFINPKVIFILAYYYMLLCSLKTRQKGEINYICGRLLSEKAMAPHSSTLAWKIPWMEEPGRLQSMGSLSQTRLSHFTFTFDFHALEKEMATHSSVLAWRIPGTGEPGGLQSMGSHRVRHDWSDLAAAAAAKHIMQNAELDEAQAEIKIARRNINNLR